jgi:uncharacterized membrane protein YhaH (DUF805 family)
MEKFFRFSGRIGRYEYWVSSFGLVGILIGMLILEAMLTMGIFALVGSIAYFIGNLSLQVRRWHDRNKSGVWILINFVPFIGTIWSFIELGFIEGTPGPNAYGLPYGASSQDARLVPQYQVAPMVQPAWTAAPAYAAPAYAAPVAPTPPVQMTSPISSPVVRCSSCGEGNEGDSRYCRKCGARMEAVQEPGARYW